MFKIALLALIAALMVHVYCLASGPIEGVAIHEKLNDYTISALLNFNLTY